MPKTKRLPLMQALVAHGSVRRVPDDDEIELFMFARDDDEGVTFSEWCVPRTEDEEEKLYGGDHAVLESIIRDAALARDFKAIPDTAKWVIRNVQGTIMPSLEDDKNMYLLLPTSARFAEERFAMPDPDARHPNPSKYMSKDVWFENCGDGGVYVLGLDDEVLVMYVDGPGDMVFGRWKCSRQQWLGMWTATFKTLEVRYPGAEAWDVLGQLSRTRSEIAVTRVRHSGELELTDQALRVVQDWVLQHWLPERMREDANAGIESEAEAMRSFLSSR